MKSLIGIIVICLTISTICLTITTHAKGSGIQPYILLLAIHPPPPSLLSLMDAWDFALGDDVDLPYITATLPYHLINLIRHHSAIRAIHLDDTVQGAFATIRPYTGKHLTTPWGLARISTRVWPLPPPLTYRSPASEGAGTSVFVLDSGVDCRHPELEGRCISGPSFVQGEPPDDLAGHGTHVAGIVASRSFGVAPRAIVHSVKVLGKNGTGPISGIVAGLLYASRVNTSSSSSPAIINMSLHTPRNPMLEEAVRLAARRGVLIITSTGNAREDACGMDPASVQSAVIAVGGTDYQDRLSQYSGVGPCVDIYAPGEDILSIWPNDQIRFLSGTSMATPHVTGVAALFRGQYTHLSSASLRRMILSSATPNTLNGPDTGSPNLLLYNRPRRNMG